MSSAAHARSLTPQELHRLLAQRDVLLVDVRDPDEHEAWRIEGSLNVPLPKLREGASIPAAPFVVVYCAHGPRSEAAQQILARRGIDAPFLAGGITAWNGVYEHVSLRTSGGAEVVQLQRVGKGCLSYVVVNGGEAVVIDPTIDINEAIGAARTRGARIVAAIDTHAHADHASGGRALADATGATYYAPAEVGDRVPHTTLTQGARVRVGPSTIEAIATPGHTPGSMTLLLDDVAFTGDTLFVESVGRPDLGQDAAQNARVLRRTLHERLLSLPPETRVLPAHRGEAPPPRGQAVVAKLRDLPARVPALAWDEATFTAWVVASEMPKPENFETIKKINLGLARVDDLDDVRDLEAGPNRCAVSK